MYSYLRIVELFQIALAENPSITTYEISIHMDLMIRHKNYFSAWDVYYYLMTNYFDPSNRFLDIFESCNLKSNRVL